MSGCYIPVLFVASMRISCFWPSFGSEAALTYLRMQQYTLVMCVVPVILSAPHKTGLHTLLVTN